MADTLTTQSATPATIPASTVIATDDAGAAGHVQVVKLAVSTDGSATHLTADNTDGILVNLGSNNDVTVAGVATAANQSTANTALSAIQTAVETLDNAISGSEMQVDVLTMPTVTVNSHAVTNAGTFAVQESGGALTSLQLIDDTVYTDGTGTPSKAVAVAGSDGTNPQIVHTDTSGDLQVDVLSVSGTVTVDGSGVTQPVSHAALTELAAAIDTEVQVDIVGALPAGTNNIGDVDVLSLPALPAGTNNIGDVDVLSVIPGTGATNLGKAEDAAHTTGDVGVMALGVRQSSQADFGADGDYVPFSVDDDGGLRVSAISNALPTGAATAANQSTMIGHLDGVEGLLTTIDADTGNISTKIDTVAGAVSGTEMQVDVVTLPALAAGTNAVGKLLPPDIDVTTHTNYAKKYYTNAGAVTDGIIWSPAAGKRWHVVSMYINVSATATVTLEDDKAGGDEAVWKGEYAANSGVTIHFGEMYPLASGEDAADLIITTSAGNVYVTVTGFEV